MVEHTPIIPRNRMKITRIISPRVIHPIPTLTCTSAKMVILSRLILLSGLLCGLQCAQCTDVKIGLLVDETASNQTWNYGGYVSTWGIAGADVTLETLRIAHLSPFQLYTAVCQMVSNSTIAFITNADCSILQSIASLVNDINVPIISIGEKCSDIPKQEDDYLLNFPPEKPDVTAVLTAMLREQKWSDMVVVYGEEEAVTHVELITSVLTRLNTTVQSFVVRRGEEARDVAAFLHYLHLHPEIQRHILLHCTIDCLTEIMTQADKYDEIADQQAWFTYDSKWVLIGERDLLDAILPHVGDVINVAAIVPSMEVYNDSSTIVMGALAKIRWSLAVVTAVMSGGTPATPHQVSSLCGAKLSLIERFSRELQLQLSTATCQNCSLYEVQSAMFVKHNGSDHSSSMRADRSRQFEVVAEWQEMNGIVLRTKVFPNVDFQLNQKQFVFGTNLWDPFVKEFENHTTGFGGLCVEILDEISRNMNFTFTFRLPADGQWGNVDNGSWTGLVGQLQRKEVEMTMAPLTVNRGRAEVMDFSNPYYLEYSTVLVKYTDPSDTKWRLYINPFRWQVWLCIGMAIPLAGVIIWLMTRFSPFYGEGEAKKGLGSLENAIFYTFGAFFTQGGVHLPEAQSGRFFIGFWWMYCTVVIATYSGNLIAFLTVSKAAVPFQTLEEMVTQNSYTFGTLGGTALVYHLQNANTGISKRMWERIEEFEAADRSTLSLRHSDHIAKVLSGGYAYMGDKTSFELEMSKESVGCNIDMIKEEFIPYQYAIGFQNNSAYKHVFDAEVSNILESGVINKWKQKWWPRPSFCSRGIVTESKAVSVSDVQGAYYLMAMFLVISFVALFSEKLTTPSPAIAEKASKEEEANDAQTVLPEYDKYGRVMVSTTKIINMNDRYATRY